MDYNKISLAKNGQVTTQIKPSLTLTRQPIMRPKGVTNIQAPTPTRLPIGNKGGLINIINNNLSKITRQPTDNSFQRLGDIAGTIVPPTPINPFANPSGAINKSGFLSIEDAQQALDNGFFTPSGLRFIPGKGLDWLTAEKQAELNKDPLAIINENKEDIIIGLVGLVIIAAGIIQIAKPI